ncbi:hypothetical protein S83_046468 [Arachis hypogaea]
MASGSGDATSVSASSSFSSFSTRSGSHMRRTFHWYDFIALGVDGMVDTDVFVTTGRVAHLYAWSRCCPLLRNCRLLHSSAIDNSRNTGIKYKSESLFFNADVHYIRSADGYFYV